MPKILILFTLLTQLTLHAQIREDHVLHFGAGMVSGAAGALIASEISNQNRFWTFSGAVAGSLLAGVAKEAIDAGQPDNRWDNLDLGATVLGGITVGVTIDLFTAKARKRRKAGQAWYKPEQTWQSRWLENNPAKAAF